MTRAAKPGADLHQVAQDSGPYQLFASADAPTGHILSEQVRAEIKAIVDQAPEFDPAQRARLRTLLRGAV